MPSTGRRGDGGRLMAYADWKIKVRRLATCSCDYGCPCEFGAKPTQLPCEGVEAFEIVDGHYADVPLTGLRVAGVYQWPGPVHEGQGTYQVVIDELATDAQRDALFTILSGEEQERRAGIDDRVQYLRFNHQSRTGSDPRSDHVRVRPRPPAGPGRSPRRAHGGPRTDTEPGDRRGASGQHQATPWLRVSRSRDGEQHIPVVGRDRADIRGVLWVRHGRYLRSVRDCGRRELPDDGVG